MLSRSFARFGFKPTILPSNNFMNTRAEKLKENKIVSGVFKPRKSNLFTTLTKSNNFSPEKNRKVFKAREMSVEKLNRNNKIRQMAVKHVMNKKFAPSGGEILMADEEAEHHEMTEALQELAKV